MIDLISPAKVNLSLRIIKKREDGFHELSSLFQTIDLCDHLKITPSKYDCFTTNSLQIPCDSSNLIIKALHLFRNEIGINQCYHINLQKTIPIQAGLGGGSSNAATTLWGLNKLNGSIISTEKLMQMGAQLGSDVPFFFSHGTAHCTGRGDVVKDVDPICLEKPLWLVKPLEGLSTKEIYNALDLSKCSEIDQLFANDLESAAFSVRPSLLNLKNTLQKLYTRVVMSGSGTAFICEGEHVLGSRVDFLNRDIGQWYKKDSITKR